MNEFWKEMERSIRCIKLVTEMLREEERLIKVLKEKGKSTEYTEYKIARMRYALGETFIKPDYRDYFYTKDEHREQE